MMKIRRSTNKDTEGQIIPVLACDHCGQEIANGRLALYHWSMQDSDVIEDSLRIYHKKPCSEMVERLERVLNKEEPRVFYWNELSALPGFVINHAALSWEQVVTACPDRQLEAVKRVIDERMERLASVKQAFLRVSQEKLVGRQALETVYRGDRFGSRLKARWAAFFDALGIGYQYEPGRYDIGGVECAPDFWLPELECWIAIQEHKPKREEEERADLLTMYTGKPTYVFWGDVRVPDVRNPEKGGYGSVHQEYWFSGMAEPETLFTSSRWTCRANDLVSPEVLALWYELGKSQVSLTLPQSQRVHLDVPGDLSADVFYALHQKVQLQKKELIRILEALSRRSGLSHARWSLSAPPSTLCCWGECPHCHGHGIYFMGSGGFQASRACTCPIPLDLWCETPTLMAAYASARQARFEFGSEPGGERGVSG